MGSKPQIWISKPQGNTEGQCDCACAAALAEHQYAALQTAWPQWESLDENRYVFALPGQHVLIFQPRRSANILVANEAAWQQLQAKSAVTHDHLVEKAYASVWNESPQELASDRILSAWLHVTSACNLNCPYCYVLRNGQMMDDITALEAVEAVFRAAQRHAYSGVKLKYAGGEPTLQFTLIQKMHQHAQKLSDETGLTLQEVLLTNGTSLTDDTLGYLAQEEMRLMVSLDGLDGGQAQLRSFSDGRSSLSLVVRGIENALAAGIRPYLSTTVTRLNLNSLGQVVEFALDHELPFSLNLYRKNACSMGEESLWVEPQALIPGIRKALDVIEERLPPYRLVDGLLDLISFAGPHENHCAAGHDYLVIDTQGQVSRCQMSMMEVVSDVRAADPLQAVRSWAKSNVQQDDVCGACLWKYYCAGGCPLLADQPGGKSPYCEVYQALLPELLRLEGLRLLKWKVGDA